jgi:hypothetical protein
MIIGSRVLALAAVLLAMAAPMSLYNPAARAQESAPSTTMASPLPPATVRALQEALNKQGITAKIDGVFGEETRAAIRQYQSQHHLPVTGEPDKATLDKLGVAARQGAMPAGRPPAAAMPGMKGQGMMGQGMMGQGMMGQGMMGPGMMGPGMMGPGMMGPGMMGPGMMGPGMMGPGMMGPSFGAMRQGDFSAEDVRRIVDGWLAWHGNARLKVGEVRQEGVDSLIADITTKAEGALVDRLKIDRRTGVAQRLP